MNSKSNERSVKMYLRKLRYKSGNLIIQQLATGSNGVVVIHGGGHSVSVDQNNKVTFSDPLFVPPRKNRNYGKCTVLTVYFPKTCKGLDAAGKELADYINRRLGRYNKVILHGHSKCGCCFLNLAQWLNRRCTIISASAPIHGTPVANKEEFSSKLNPFMRFFYKKIFSDHQVDRDICPDSEFIRNLNLKHVVRNHTCYILVSKCGFSLNPKDWLLWFLDKAFGINGDGIVPEKSQIPRGVRYERITASHASSMKKSLNFQGKPDWLK